MCNFLRFLVVAVVCANQLIANGQTLRGPPRVENKPLLLTSYIPASMQVIAHLTDLMKYDLKPQKVPPTSTTVRPTPPHRPGLYAPESPPGPESYFKNVLDGPSYFVRYKLTDIGADSKAVYKEIEDNLSVQDVPDLELFGRDYHTFLKFVSRIEPDAGVNSADEEEAVRGLLNGLDDSKFGMELLRQKRIPPTRAYVTLLQLYDVLNKESKKLSLNKYGGYSDEVLRVLIASSYATSAEQLNTVLSKVVERRDTTNEAILKKIDPLLKDLEKSDSYLNDALKYIPPLQFVP